MPSTGNITIGPGGVLLATPIYSSTAPISGWLANGPLAANSVGAIALPNGVTDNESITIPAALTTLSLGAVGNATFSGTLVPAVNTYYLGGSGGTLTFTPGLTGTNSLVAGIGGGTVILTGTNTYTGSTTVSAGTLAIVGTGLLGGGNYGTAIANSGALVMNTASNQIFSGTISGAGALYQTGSGITTLSGGNITYSGPTAINGGQLVLQNTTGYVSNTTIASGGTLNVALSSQWTISTGALNITGNGTLVKSGTATWYVGSGTGHVNFNMGPGGLIDILGGTIQNNYDGTSFGNNQAGVNIAAGAILNFYAENGQMDYLTGAGTLQNGYPYGGHGVTIGVANGSGTFSGLIQDGCSMALSLTKTGSGIETLSGPNTYTGATTITGGTLEIGGAGVLGGGNYGANIANSGALVVNTSSNQTFAGVISGNGSLTQSGPGTLSLSNAANSYSGGTNVLGGTLYVSGASLPSSGTLTVAAGTLSTADGAARTTTVGGLNLGNGATLAMDWGDQLSTAATATASGYVVLAPSGTFTSGTPYTFVQAAAAGWPAQATSWSITPTTRRRSASPRPA